MPGVESGSVEPTAPSIRRLTAWIAIRPASENIETKLYTIDPTNHLWYSHERGRALGVA